jgi:hypothetical protein
MKRTILCVGLALFILPNFSIAQSESPDSKFHGELFARDTFRLDTVVCPFKGKIDYEPGEIECYLLQVPENREKPGSRFIELHVVKLNSTWDDEEAEEAEKDEDEHDYGLAPGKRDDPIVYLTGGPGALVTYYIKRFKDHGIRKHRDMYILEQRGIGYSNDFCPYYDITTFASRRSVTSRPLKSTSRRLSARQSTVRPTRQPTAWTSAATTPSKTPATSKP